MRVGARLLGPPGFWRLGERTLAVNLLWPDLDLRPAQEASDDLPSVGAPGLACRPMRVSGGPSRSILRIRRGPTLRCDKESIRRGALRMPEIR